MNPHQCQHLRSIPKIINNLNAGGNITLGKLNYRTAVYIFYRVFNITYFFHHLCTLFHCYVSNKLGKQTIFCISTYFMIRTTYDEFQSSTTDYAVRLKGNEGKTICMLKK